MNCIFLIVHWRLFFLIKANYLFSINLKFDHGFKKFNKNNSSSAMRPKRSHVHHFSFLSTQFVFPLYIDHTLRYRSIHLHGSCHAYYAQETVCLCNIHESLLIVGYIAERSPRHNYADCRTNKFVYFCDVFCHINFQCRIICLECFCHRL